MTLEELQEHELNTVLVSELLDCRAEVARLREQQADAIAEVFASHAKVAGLREALDDLLVAAEAYLGGIGHCHGHREADADLDNLTDAMSNASTALSTPADEP